MKNHSGTTRDGRCTPAAGADCGAGAAKAPTQDGTGDRDVDFALR